jgi:hypothetical protein
MGEKSQQDELLNGMGKDYGRRDESRRKYEMDRGTKERR